MTGKLWRRGRRNAGRVLSLFVREVLFSARGVVGLGGAALGVVAVAGAVGAVLAGGLAWAAVLGAVGATATYGGWLALLGAPRRGAGVVLAGLLVVGGGAHALGVGPATSDTATPAGESGETHQDAVSIGGGLNVHPDEGSDSDVGLSTRSDDELPH